MTRRIHNKKRNVGILYELLVRKVSESLVEGDEKTSDKSLQIIEEFFKKDSVLLREYRLFSALTKTYVESDNVVSKLLAEARRGAESFDNIKLEQEKDRLIKRINKTFDDSNFFNTKIPEYKSFASIQTLLSAWRNPEKHGIGRIAECEERVSALLKEKKEIKNLEDLKVKDVDSLTTKLMVEKFNKKFKTLSSSQKRVLDAVLTCDKKQIVEVLTQEKAIASSSLNNLKKSETSDWILRKIDKVGLVIESLDPKDASDENVQKFMTVTHMSNLITEEK